MFASLCNFARRDPLGFIGLVLVALILFAGLFGGWLAPYSPSRIDVPARLLAPSWEHVMGTDKLGRDVFSRTLMGAQYSLLMGFGATLISFAIGVPPMYSLAKRLLAAGKTPAAILGFNTASEIFYKEEFEALGIETILATADGSVGSKGFVTDALPEAFDTFCACGPMPMLRALCARTKKPGFLSLEARMGCGFGACMGCTIETAHGPKRICKEGPVFRKEELIW